MVNRIEPIRPTEAHAVDKVRDDDERQQQQQNENDEEGEGDAFDKLSEKTDWNILFEKSHLWQDSLDLEIRDIKEIKFVSVNLKTDPCLVQISVELKDGTRYANAFLSLARAIGLRMKNTPRGGRIPLGDLTRGRSITITVPKDENQVKEEITRVTRDPRERTVSYTMKKLPRSRPGLLVRLGLKNPVSRRINSEIVWIYLTVFILGAAFIFGGFYLAR